MGSFKQPRAFDPLDLEIIDRVYEAAWAQLEAREPFRDREKDGERGEALRKLVFAFASSDKIDFDVLCDQVLANMPVRSPVPPSKRGRKIAGGAPGV
jgi:hypothetical protein